MDGTDAMCAFGLAADHTGCEGRLGRIQEGEDNVGHPLVEGRVCGKCANVVTAVRLYFAERHIAKHEYKSTARVVVRAWVDFCNGVGLEKPKVVEWGLAIESKRLFIEEATRQSRMLAGALERLDVGDDE